MHDEVTHELELDQEMPLEALHQHDQQAVVKKKQSLLSEVRDGNRFSGNFLKGLANIKIFLVGSLHQFYL